MAKPSRTNGEGPEEDTDASRPDEVVQRAVQKIRDRYQLGKVAITSAPGGSKAHGVSRTSAALGLDYFGLKKRAEAAEAPPLSCTPAFLELTPPVLVAKQCRLEPDNGSGATMRVQQVGYDAADVEALSRRFWDAL